MRKIRISLSGDGRIRIKLKKKKDSEPEGQQLRQSTSSRILLSRSLIDQMEIRAESVFRPDQADIEVVYALTGSEDNLPDMLHKFSSSEVVPHATGEKISYYTAKMAEHIKEERDDPPGLIVIIHTHPGGIPELSDVDKNSHRHVAEEMRKSIPRAAVLFGVHAVSQESRRARTMPENEPPNKIRWNSITRLHEVAFFNNISEPVEVRIWEA